LILLIIILITFASHLVLKTGIKLVQILKELNTEFKRDQSDLNNNEVQGK